MSTCLVMGSRCHGDHPNKQRAESATRCYDYSNSSIYICKSLLSCRLVFTLSHQLCLLLLSLDHFFPARVISGQPKRCNCPCNSQQESVALLLSRHFQPQPGARADELRCCVLYIYTCLNSLKPEKPWASTVVGNTQRFAHRMR